MNVKTMRKIDSYAGSVVCLVLDIYEWFKHCFVSPPEPANTPPRTILVTKYLGMGSILLATPTLAALKEAFPSSRILFLTFASNAEFARQIDIFDEVIAVRTGSIIQFAVDMVSVLIRLRRARIDVAFDLEFFARFSTIVTYLSGARRRIGYYLPKLWRGDLLTDQIHFNPYRHVTEIFAAQLEPYRLTVHDFSLIPPRIDPRAVARVRELLAADRPGGQKMVVVNVNASDLSQERRWPLENFRELLQGFAARYDVKFVLIGSRGEQEFVGSFFSSLDQSTRDRVVNLTGQLQVTELIALLSCCCLVISNDSGPLHIAASLQIPTIAFYGPETPLLYGPRGGRQVIFYAGIYCSPCLNVYNAKKAMCNGDNRCMQAIRPADVLQEIERQSEEGGVLSFLRTP